ncbi:hypothetical protein JB92DRAFT_785265 [Gautieria morchelliformis]|nr:hypothetical protein JB92DRAFT_785265 [Gautieria morchelliformis]
MYALTLILFIGFTHESGLGLSVRTPASYSMDCLICQTSGNPVIYGTPPLALSGTMPAWPERPSLGDLEQPVLSIIILLNFARGRDGQDCHGMALQQPDDG